MARVVLFVMLCSLLLPAYGSVISPEDKKRVEDVMQALMECRGIIGLSLAVVKGNQSWTRGFGLADVEQGLKVTSSTRFVLASAGKAFTAALLAIVLQDSSNVTWTSKVTSVLGEEFRLVDDVRTEQANLVDVLAHRTGLQNQQATLFTGYPAHVTRKEVVSRLRYLNSSGEFRDGFSYNNWMYLLAGRITEVLTGEIETWETLLHKRLLTPLAMTSSGVVGRDLDMSHPSMAKAYKMVEGRMTRVDDEVFSLLPFAPAGVIASSAEDMVHWLRFMLGRGRSGSGRQLLRESHFTALTSLHNGVGQRLVGVTRPAFPVSDIVLGYGLGWYISLYRGREKWEHAGFLHGFQSNVCIFPAENVAIFLVMNGMTSYNEFSRDVICYVIADILMGEEAWLNSSTACHFRSPHEASQPQEKTTASTSCSVPERDPGPYTGTYGNRLLGDVEVKVNSSLDALVLTCNRLVVLLTPTLDASQFEGHVQGPVRFWNYPGAEFRPLPVRFLDLADQKYRKVELFGDPVFSRDVRFEDLLANGGGSLQSEVIFVLVSVALIAWNREYWLAALFH